MQRHRFGRKAESLPEKQMLLGLEDVQQVAACTEGGQDEAAPEGRAERARKRRGNRGALPAHLPRIEVVVDINDKTCPRRKGDLHQIGEDRSERLDMVPAQFCIVVTRRPKYACRACEDGVMQAPAPVRLVEGGLPTEAIAQVLVSKYADHPPLYRQAQSMPARASISIGRHWRIGWGIRPSICVRCMNAFSRRFARGPGCSPTRRRCRCSILVEGVPRPASSGPVPPMTEPGAVSTHPESPTSTHPTAKQSSYLAILPASRCL
jgi:transposase